MGDLTVHLFTTLDGVIQAPGGPDEDTSDGFAHGGWFAPFSVLLETPFADAVRAAKEAHPAVHVIGSGDLARSLLAEGLVDRLDLYVCPVSLGTGKRLFDEGTVPARWALESATTFQPGSVQLVYRHAGEPTYGSMGG